jgi:hypothetical protein
MGNISPRSLRTLSPRSLRERMARTPRGRAEVPPPAPDEEIDPEFVAFCERLKQVLPVFTEPVRCSVDVPSDSSSSAGSPTPYDLTASGAHRIRLSIACRLPADEVDSDFWRATLSSARV